MLWVLSVRSIRKVVSWLVSCRLCAMQSDVNLTRRTRKYVCCQTIFSTACDLPSTCWHCLMMRRCCTRGGLWCTSWVQFSVHVVRYQTHTMSLIYVLTPVSWRLGLTCHSASWLLMVISTDPRLWHWHRLQMAELRHRLSMYTSPRAQLHERNRCSRWVAKRSYRSCRWCYRCDGWTNRGLCLSRRLLPDHWWNLQTTLVVAVSWPVHRHIHHICQTSRQTSRAVTNTGRICRCPMAMCRLYMQRTIQHSMVASHCHSWGMINISACRTTMSKCPRRCSRRRSSFSQQIFQIWVSLELLLDISTILPKI